MDEKKLKVAIYIRVGREEQDENYILSQKKVLSNYADKYNTVFKNYYIDNGYSGRNFNRLGFKKMFNDIVNEKINAVIVKDLSRFSRDIFGMKKIYELNKKYNTEFISLDNSINTLKNKDDFIQMQSIQDFIAKLPRRKRKYYGKKK